MQRRGAGRARPTSGLREGADRGGAAKLGARIQHALAVGLLLLGGCAQPLERGTEGGAAQGIAAGSMLAAEPPCYRISGGGGATLGVLGTLHVGPPRGFTLAPQIEAAIEEADVLVREIDPRRATEDAVSSRLAELAILPVGTQLTDVLAPETQKLLEREDAALTRLGFPRNARKFMKPWIVAVGLAEGTYAEAGFVASGGLEEHLVKVLADRPLVGLETFEEQLQMLDGLSEALQDLVLRDSLARLPRARAEFDEMVEAWRGGDEIALEAVAYQGIEELPELEAFYAVLLQDRNRRWIETLLPKLRDPAHRGETWLVAVGALHLVGRNGLIEGFRAAGFRAKSLAAARSGAGGLR